MSDFIEWNPKHHGHKPLHWTPDMLTSVDGKNFARQSNWAWIAGSTYYVPREAVGVVRKDVEPEPEQTDVDRTNYCTGCKERQDRIEALTAENERLLVSNEQWQVDYNEAVIDKLELETEIDRLRGIGLHLVQHINWVTNGLPDLLEDACLTDEEGVINAAIAAATEARAALEKQP